MRKFLITLIFLAIFINGVHAEEILRINYDRSKVVDIEDGKKEYSLKDFMASEPKLIEGHQIEMNVIIYKEPASNPLDTYVLEMRTELQPPIEWNYKIPGKKTQIYETVKSIVWENSDHFAPEFEISMRGRVPRPEIPIKEPNFEDYNGKGPGLRKIELAVFTIYDGQVDPSKIVDKIGTINFVATNSKINDKLTEIDKSLNTSDIGKEYVASLGEQKEYIKELSNTGHIGIALDLSKNFEKFVKNIKSISPPDNKKLVFVGIIGLIIALIIGIVIGKTMQ